MKSRVVILIAVWIAMWVAFHFGHPIGYVIVVVGLAATVAIAVEDLREEPLEEDRREQALRIGQCSSGSPMYSMFASGQSASEKATRLVPSWLWRMRFESWACQESRYTYSDTTRGRRPCTPSLAFSPRTSACSNRCIEASASEK
jgi:hypothetical protein